MEAERTFQRFVEGSKSPKYVSSVFDRLYHEATTKREERSELRERSLEVQRRSYFDHTIDSSRSRSRSWSRTPHRKIGKREAKEIYRWFILKNQLAKDDIERKRFEK